MKNQMHIFYLILLCLYFGSTISKKISKKSKNPNGYKHLVIDNSSGPSLTQVVRRAPTVNYSETSFPASRTTTDNSNVSFSNSNSNNAGGDIGKTAFIVGPSIMLHGHGTVSAVKETPAHVGIRTEKTTITSLNKQTGKVEEHVVDSKVPIVGMVQEVKTLKTHTTRKYDINTNSLGPISTSVSE